MKRPLRSLYNKFHIHKNFTSAVKYISITFLQLRSSQILVIVVFYIHGYSRYLIELG